jgi:amino acid adenylation domain-containing protein
LQIHPIALEASPARCDLTLVMRDNGATGSFEYDGDLFEAPTIDRLAANFQRLLEGLVADPNRGIEDVELVTEEERHAILDRFNDAPSVPPPPAALAHQRFEAAAAARPEAAALRWIGGSMTYQELDTRANQLAQELRRLGAQPETIVGLYLPRSPEMVIGLLAAMKAGAAYLPLDPSAPQERLAYMLDDSGAQIVLTHSALRERLGNSPAAVIALDGEWPATAPGERTFAPVHQQNLAYVIYTSGSTGRPKGTLLTHEGLRNYVSWAIDAYALDQGAGAPVHSPLGFDLTITSLLVPLAAGQTVTLIDEVAGIDSLVESLRAGPNFSLVKLTPAHLEVLGRQLSPAQASQCARFMVIGGENLSAETTAFWREHAPHTTLVNEYGPTETVVGCCVYTVPADLPESLPTVPIGRPIHNTQLYVLDQRMRPVPIGVSGELFIGGLGLARGYLNRPDLTAQRFVPHPFGRQPGERLYRTGDLARYRDDGVLECLGRLDHQVKIRGYRIELGEIEAVLGQHPSVRETAVIAWTDPGDEKQLVAYVVPEAASAVAPCELRDFLRERLPEYMVPAAFVSLDAMPLTKNGKLDRRALPEPDDQRGSSETVFVAPRTPLEEVLAGIWAEVLQVDAVGVNDNFFALGGHSLVAIQAITRVRELFNMELLLRTFFESPTVAQLAMAIEADPAGREKAATIAGILARLDRLPDEELERELDSASRGAA